ncbi:MAG: type II secretion system F family protein [Phycisphaerae bacterium]|nr:type II secretion system F family protein [Phycisphaerae bacterium]
MVVLISILIFFVTPLVLVAVILGHAGTVARRLQDQELVDKLSMIVSQNLPLAPALHALARDARGWNRRRIRTIAHGIERGLPLSEAFRCADRSCPGEIIGTIAAAEWSGTLAPALRTLSEKSKRRAAQRDRNQWFVIPYALAVFAILTIEILFFDQGIFPHFLELFSDSGMKVPRLTDSVFHLVRHDEKSREPAEELTTGAMLRYTLWSVLGLGVVFLTLRSTPRRTGKPGLLMRAGDSIRWLLPGLHGIELARGLATALPAIEFALVAGWPLEAAVDRAAAVDVNVRVRRRLAAWADAMKRGDSPPSAARGAGLPELLIQALAGGMREGDPIPGIHYARGYYEAICRHWQLWLAQAAWPVVTLVLGAFVGLFVVAVIAPMAELVRVVCASIQ